MAVLGRVETEFMLYMAMSRLCCRIMHFSIIRLIIVKAARGKYIITIFAANNARAW